jgi:hypothetical protein
MTGTTADAHMKFRSRALPRADQYFVRESTGAAVDDSDALQRLLARSLDDNGLDWDALARVDIDGWGANLDE